MEQKKINSKYAMWLIIIYLLAQLIPVALIMIWPSLNPIYTQVGAFAIGTILLIYCASKIEFSFEKKPSLKAYQLIAWGVIGTGMAYMVQILAGMVELYIFGISPSSANTNLLLEFIRSYPIFILLTVVFAPIMEELVFRKAINGILVEKIGWVGGAVISSLIFAMIHFDGHILIYASMGLVFSYLYYKSNNIWVPIISHALMNALVVVINFI